MNSQNLIRSKSNYIDFDIYLNEDDLEKFKNIEKPLEFIGEENHIKYKIKKYQDDIYTYLYYYNSNNKLLRVDVKENR